MIKKTSKKSLLDAYRFDNFKTSKTVKGRFGDKAALVLSLARRSKKVSAPNAAGGIVVGTTESARQSGICHAATAAFIWSSTSDVFAVGRLDW